MSTPVVRWFAIAVATVALTAASCSSNAETTSSETVADSALTTSGEALSTIPELSGAPSSQLARPIGVVDVFGPSGSPGERTLVVIVPGGGWVDADPGGLVPLAQALAEAGMVAVTTTYRASSDSAYFPVPAEDVACAIASAGEVSSAAGFPPGETVVVGHSSGAHLAALVALRPEEFSSDCAAEPLVPDRFIGLAGPYDVTRARGPGIELFGPDNPDPTNWDDGNPVAHADQRPELAVMLAHGVADSTVPVFFTEAFAAALRAGFHEMDEFYLDGVDHHGIYSAETAGPIILEWLEL